MGQSNTEVLPRGSGGGATLPTQLFGSHSLKSCIEVYPILCLEPTLDHQLWKVCLEILSQQLGKMVSLLLPITHGVVVNQTLLLVSNRLLGSLID